MEALSKVMTAISKYSNGNSNKVELTKQELEEAPFDAGQYRLEGTTLTFVTDDESEYCTGATGSYVIILTEESQIEFTHDEDPCWERRMGLMAEPWVWVEP